MTPPRPFPTLLTQNAVLFGLVGLNVLVFVAQMVLPESLWFGWMCVPVDVVAAWEGLSAGRFSPATAQSFATLLTYAFMHGDIEHLLFNLLYLWIFGFLAGELLGQRWVLLLYLLTALGGGIIFVIFNGDSPIPMLGASGAVLGFQGAYLGLAVRSRLPDAFVWPLANPVSPFHLGIFAVIGVVLDLSGTINPGTSNTAFATHLGGFLTGVFLTSFVSPPARHGRTA